MGVDFARVDAAGELLADPFCYRDERAVTAMRELHERIPAERMRELTGMQLIAINTLYQIFADRLAKLDEGVTWMNLPEYMLSRWGGERVAELTNATHTELVELYTRQWCGGDL